MYQQRSRLEYDMDMVEDKPVALVLATPAEKINSKHLEVKRLELTAKDVAAEVGEMLIEFKQSLPHGEFKKWVEDNCSFSYSTAKDYMNIAKAKRQRAALFDECTSIREVLELGKPEDSCKNYEPKQPKPKMDKDDQRKVRKLQAVIDDPAADPNTVEACKRKLDGYKTAHGEKAVEDYLESVIEDQEEYDIIDIEPIMEAITDIIFDTRYDLKWRKAQVQDWLEKAFDGDDNGMIAELNFLKENKNDWT